MAFAAVEIENNAPARAWVSKVMQGFMSVDDDKLSILTDRFEIVESKASKKKNRMFLIRTTSNVPLAFWTMGFFLGVASFVVFGKLWLLLVSLFSALTLWVFTSSFLRFTVRLSLWKSGYKADVKFYDAEDTLGLVGLRTIATLQEEEVKDQ